ncbi:TRAP transporter large permease subunit [Alcanivorax sp. VBW004]|uniref:TRAP transporter large permease subunit n=1 Tax=Alcanivorax sp. VBW004 TaxID=1287708 RepID=UPI0012BC8453|nr:TRAP transporter large permease subunit [Alcanivorax sp. VBW004]MTT53867.1 TRAP transporter large permease subunit [Alcanivorax sp. VBW004]
MATSLRMERRTAREWFSSLPTLLLLLLTIFLASGQVIHSQLLSIGENTWDNYFQLRSAGALNEPTCNADADLDRELERAIAEKKQKMADDPLAGFFGTEIDEKALRQSLESAQTLCREKWANYQMVQEKVTPGVIAFRTLEGGVAQVVSILGDYKRLILCLLLLICAATATLTRHHIALRPARTRKDHLVSTLGQLTANVLLLASALIYRSEEIKAMADGVQVNHFYLHQVWIGGFAILSAASLWQLFSPPKDLEEGGSWGKALLTIPLYAYMCLSASIQFMSQGYLHGTSVYLGMMMEFSTMFLSLGLYIWVGMMLRQTKMVHLVFDVLRPWRMSPELMCFVILAVTAIPTAYTGASGIFIIAAGATVYHELVRAGARKQLALAGAAMSGSMGVVLRPCLLVVIIAALNNSVTTDELFTSGIKVFGLSLLLFFIYSQFARTEPARIAPFSQAFPASLKRLVPLLPYVIVIGTVVVVFRDILGAQLNENYAPIILPMIMLAVLIYEKFSRHFLHLCAAVLALLLIHSSYDAWLVSNALDAGNIPSGTSANQLSDTLTGLFWRNLILGISLLIHYLFKPSGEVSELPAKEEGVGTNLESSLRFSTNETTGHIGALLMLMALTVSMGGLLERSGIMEALPETFPSIWVAMTLLVVTMVIIGMIMDPFGAVILVNATIAQVAFDNGIAPLHFWMISLVAFELGYLSPPVALNHLLTRQVVGDDEVESAKVINGSFYRRYEKYLLPIAVMLTALLLVAFVPLLSDSLHHWLFQKIDVTG